MIDDASVEQLVQVVIRGVAEGRTVEIEPLGVFYPDREKGFRFEARAVHQVFIAYGSEDREQASELYDALEAGGFHPWLDVRRLLPGQNWPRAIENAIETSDFFVPCFSTNSVNKRGGFQAEIRYALDCARRVPLDDMFVVPVRLNACRLPRSIQNEYQYIDLFPDRAKGIRRMLSTMRRELERRRGAEGKR